MTTKSPAENPDSFILVCPDAWGEDPAFAPDNLHGPCDRCGRPCHWRPHVPEMRKICAFCAPFVVTPAHIPTVTIETMRELSSNKKDQA